MNKIEQALSQVRLVANSSSVVLRTPMNRRDLSKYLLPFMGFLAGAAAELAAHIDGVNFDWSRDFAVLLALALSVFAVFHFAGQGDADNTFNSRSNVASKLAYSAIAGLVGMGAAALMSKGVFSAAILAILFLSSVLMYKVWLNKRASKLRTVFGAILVLAVELALITGINSH